MDIGRQYSLHSVSSDPSIQSTVRSHRWCGGIQYVLFQMYWRQVSCSGSQSGGAETKKNMNILNVSGIFSLLFHVKFHNTSIYLHPTLYLIEILGVPVSGLLSWIYYFNFYFRYLLWCLIKIFYLVYLCVLLLWGWALVYIRLRWMFLFFQDYL